MQMRCIAQQKSARPTARMPHTHSTHAGEDSHRDKKDAPAVCAVPFRPHCGGVATRTRNVSEYMLVLALPSYLMWVFTSPEVEVRIIAIIVSVCLSDRWHDY